MTPVNIWIVEDDSGYRRNLQISLQRQDHITCSRTFPNCIKFLEAIESGERPDVVLMDLGLPQMGGVEGIERLKAIDPDVSVLVLTVEEKKETVMQALDAGAMGYLLKASSVQEIVNALEQVIKGGAALGAGVAKLVLGEVRKPVVRKDFGLSGREIEVLEQLAEGLSSKEIGAKLCISTATVNFHLGRIYQKLDVQSQTGAVAKALRSELI
ncbi:response regulator transcription factor [Pelagicoccus sp. SDUM812005]|uniref:response regulator transcription factor n=1 Tax=Pelagicoccus sp. SDUM812005 TaxID=3041257 RepID=UPI0028106D1D|nr:response regulator transcription factor [Pelagicoccus sp. SDUM812005]MDQ8183823.1 response regulator transcription factor [Pelagicoccus sp. SDUM812005]